MRAFILVAGAAMAISFGMTWIEIPFAGPDISPASAVSEGRIDPFSGRWQSWVFLGGFALAALAALLALLGKAGAGMIGLLAGVTPFVVLIDAWLRFDEVRRDLNLPFPIEIRDLGDVAAVADDFLRLGVWVYLGGAVLLVLAALSGARR